MPPYLSTSTPPPPIRASHHSSAQSADPAFSEHALRRLSALLHLKYLELREEHLEYVRRVIEEHLGPDALFREPGTTVHNNTL
jgi:hypothetical protein